MANLSKLSLPLGYRFCPSDVVLVMHYLKRKVMGRPFKLKGDIPYIALNNFSPSEVREMSYPKTKDLEGFFFCSLGNRYSNGQRKNRSSKCGYWKATGKDKAIYNKSRKVGWRRTVTFYRGKAPGTITDWRIHEYRLEDKELPIASNYQNEFVMCKIFDNKSRGPKTDEEYESPVEDDADESSSIGPEEGQNIVATSITLDFVNRQDTLQPLPPHTATPIVLQHQPSSPENDVHKLLLNVCDEDGDTCNGGGSSQVDSVPNKSTGEDVDASEIEKNLEDITASWKMEVLSRGLPGGFLEEEDLNKPMEDEEGCFNGEDLFIPMAADGSNHGTSDCLLATNVTPVLPANEAMDSCDYENIPGYGEPTCDSAARSPLKAGEIVGPYAPQSLARGLTEGFLEEEDLSKPMEDEEGYFYWEDFLLPMAADGSNHGTSDCLLATNVTPVLPAHEAMDSCDYENIPGYREPTCDSAAHSPLKAGEIVGPYAPQSLARGKQLDLHLGLECISKEGWLLTNVQFLLGSIVACPASATVYPSSLDCKSYRVGCGFSCSIIVKDEVTIIYTHDGLLGMSRSFPFWSYLDQAEMLVMIGTISMSIDFMFVFILSAVSALTGALCACCRCQTWEASMAAPFAALL